MKLASTFALIACLSLPLVATAADGPSGHAGNGAIEPTFASIQANLFTPGCALSFCHGAAQSAGLDLRAGLSYANLVNFPSAELAGWDRIEPFLPESSYLVCKIEACPSMVGQLMPVIGGPLDPSVIEVVRHWVAKGALEFSPISVEGSTWGQVKARYR